MRFARSAMVWNTSMAEMWCTGMSSRPTFWCEGCGAIRFTSWAILGQLGCCAASLWPLAQKKSESPESLPESPVTLQIATLWYRAPEICLRCHDYGTPVDMWAFGCVCMEILSKKVAFQGTSDMHMLSLIFWKFGHPNKTRKPQNIHGDILIAIGLL